MLHNDTSEVGLDVDSDLVGLHYDDNVIGVDTIALCFRPFSNGSFCDRFTQGGDHFCKTPLSQEARMEKSQWARRAHECARERSEHLFV